MSHWCFFFPSNFFETSAIFFGSLFDVNLCWMVSTSNSKDLISLLSHNCSRLLRAFKCSLLLDVLLGFCDNKAAIVCIAFRIIDRSGAFCVYAFRSLVTYLIIYFLHFQLLTKITFTFFREGDFLISFIKFSVSYSPSERCNWREHFCHFCSFGYSNRPAWWNWYYVQTFGPMTVVLAQTSVGAELTAAATWASILILLRRICLTVWKLALLTGTFWDIIKV